jgi:hypothetical protein
VLEEATMRARVGFAIGAVGAALGLGVPQPGCAGSENPNGFGLYSPLGPGGRAGAYRYDPRSWYYRQPRYYPYYNSGYWVPREYMRYRYRYSYYGPRYRYFPAWGFGPAADPCCAPR